MLVSVSPSAHNARTQVCQGKWISLIRLRASQTAGKFAALPAENRRVIWLLTHFWSQAKITALS